MGSLTNSTKQTAHPAAWDPTPSLAWEMPGNPIIRLWNTCWQVLLRPSQAFATLGVEGYLTPVLMGLLFIVLSQFVHFLTNVFFNYLNLIDSEAARAMTYPQLLGWCINNNFQASWKDMVQSTLWTGLRIMVLAGSVHLVLCIFKAAQLKFLATFKVMAYGWISILLLAIFTSVPTKLINFVNGPNGSGEPFGLIHYYNISSMILLFIWMGIIAYRGLGITHQASRKVMICTAMVASLALVVFEFSLFVFGMFYHGIWPLPW
jgi:hypothetical protein